MGIEELVEELRLKIDTLCDTVKNKLALMGEMTIDELIEAINNANVITQWSLEFSDKMPSYITVTFPELSVSQMTDDITTTMSAPITNGVISDTISDVQITHMTISVNGMTDSVEATTTES